jgi:predicted permease
MPPLASFLTILTALSPIILLIAAGYGLKHLRFLQENQWQPIDRLNYFVLFPALLLTSVAKADLAGSNLLPLLGGALGGVLGIALLVMLLRRAAGGDGPAHTSVLQGATRFNTYVALGSAASVLGPASLSVMAMTIAFAVPLINVICVAGLLAWGAGNGRLSPGNFLMQLARNPLILGCLAGLAVNGLGGLPPIIRPTLEIIAGASLALGLLSVGASIDLSSVRHAGRAVLFSGGLKLIAFPVLAALIARLLGADSLTLGVVVLFASMPTATAATVLARQMGGDVRLMAAITTFETLAAALTIPVMLALLR